MEWTRMRKYCKHPTQSMSAESLEEYVEEEIRVRRQRFVMEVKGSSTVHPKDVPPSSSSSSAVPPSSITVPRKKGTGKRKRSPSPLFKSPPEKSSLRPLSMSQPEDSEFDDDDDDEPYLRPRDLKKGFPGEVSEQEKEDVTPTKKKRDLVSNSLQQKGGNG